MEQNKQNKRIRELKREIADLQDCVFVLVTSVLILTLAGGL